MLILLLLIPPLFQWVEEMGRLGTLNVCRFIIDITQPPVALNLSQGQGMIEEEGEGSRRDH